MATRLFLLVVWALLGYLGIRLVQEAGREDFFSRPSGTFLDSFTASYRIRDHPVFGDKGPLLLKVVGVAVLSLGFIGLLTFVLGAL